MTAIQERVNVDPRDFGPEINLAKMSTYKGDGSNEDTALAEVAAAINAAGGGTIQWPSKTVNHNSPVPQITVPVHIKGTNRGVSRLITTQPIKQLDLASDYVVIEDMRVSNDTTSAIHAGEAVGVRSIDTGAGFNAVESFTAIRSSFRGFTGLHIESAFQCTLDDVRLSSSLWAGLWIENRFKPDSGDHKFNNLMIAGDGVNVSTTCTGTSGQNTLTVVSQAKLIKDMVITAKGTDVYTIQSVSGSVLTVTPALVQSYAGDTLTATPGVHGILYNSGGGMKFSNSKIVKYQNAFSLIIGTFTPKVIAGTGAQNTSGQKDLAVDNIDGCVNGQSIYINPGGGNQENGGSSVAITSSVRNADGTGVITLSTNLASTHSANEQCYVGVSTSPGNISNISFENQTESLIQVKRQNNLYGTFHSLAIANNEFAAAQCRAAANSAIMLQNDGLYDTLIGPNVSYGRSGKDQAFIEVYATTAAAGDISILTQKTKTYDSVVKIGNLTQVLIDPTQHMSSVNKPFLDSRTVGNMKSPVEHRVSKYISTSTPDVAQVICDIDMTGNSNAAALVEIEVTGTINSAITGFVYSSQYLLTRISGTVTATAVRGPSYAKSTASADPVGLMTFAIDTATSGHAKPTIMRATAATGTSFACVATVRAIGSIKSVTP